jgi:quercetin dioxygenase-like cupin family protein
VSIRVYDYRTDIANLVVHPEIRGRFMRLEPGPAGRRHSHDLGGEIFLVLEGQCGFIVGEERVTCGPGQLIYVEPRVRHTLHAAGDAPCVVYLSVTPHVEPTHTLYDERDERLPPRYGTWRGPEHADPNADTPAAELARRYAAAARALAERAAASAALAEARLPALGRPPAVDGAPELKAEIDALWLQLRAVLEQVSAVERAWNDLAPRAMPAR